MKDEETKPKPKATLPTDEIIKKRTNLFMILAGGALVAVVAVKICMADFGQAFSNFQFSDLLSLILALFSIGVAILFYLKATDTSNIFYDNSYKFTKDVSEILGRIEAGFGERLKHLDDGYAGVRDRLEKMPLDVTKTEKKIEKEKDQVERVERERQAIFEELAAKAKLEQKEKEAYFQRLKAQEEELLSARRDLSMLQRRLMMQEREGGSDLSQFPAEVIHRLQNHILAQVPSGYFRRAPSEVVNRRFRKVVESMPDDFTMMLREFGVVDDDGDLTRSGMSLIRKLSSEQYAGDNG